MPLIPFRKMNGLGNDFLVVDARGAPVRPAPEVIRALADRKSGGAAQRHVLADLGDGLGKVLGDRVAAGLGRLDLLDIGADVERHIGDHLHEALEQVVARDEVGFGVDLDDHALGALDGDANQTLGGDAIGFLRSL